jgi:hypothetical protein
LLLGAENVTGAKPGPSADAVADCNSSRNLFASTFCCRNSETVACRSWRRIDFCINQERPREENDEIVLDSAQPFEKSRFVEEMNLDFLPPSLIFLPAALAFLPLDLENLPSRLGGLKPSAAEGDADAAPGPPPFTAPAEGTQPTGRRPAARTS